MHLRRYSLAVLTAGLLGSAGLAHAADEPAPAAAPAPKPPPAPVLTNVVVIPAPKADEVLSPQLREHLLNVVGRDLNRANATLEAKLPELPNPFFPKPPPAPVEPIPVAPPPSNSTPAAGAPAVPVVVKLSDQDRLAQLAEKLKPSGTMVKSGQRVLVFTNNPPMLGGQSLRVRFPGDDKDSEVVITDITENSYTLKLNDTVLPVPFNRPGASGTIQRAAPGAKPPATPSPAPTSKP